jgi:hypothetical protein
MEKRCICCEEGYKLLHAAYTDLMFQKSFAYFIKPNNRIRYQLYANPTTIFYYTAQSVSTEVNVLNGSLLELPPLNLALGWLLTFPHNVSIFRMQLNIEAPRPSDT